MNALYVISGGVSCLILFYLLVALLKPEIF
jgi:hypothetical protein